MSAFSFGHYFLNKLTYNHSLQRLSDNRLGTLARQVAAQRQAVLFSYSYYASSAFSNPLHHPRPRLLFQLHPHPVAVRRILLEELDRVPSARTSLKREHELALPEDDFRRLAMEPLLADHVFVASSFSRQTLIEHGVSPEAITVVPYGVDSAAFAPPQAGLGTSSSVTVAWVGQLCQRKGLSYFLDAVRLLKTTRLRVELCGRGVVDHTLLKNYSDLNLNVILAATRSRLIKSLQESDIYVLPSLVEGFGQTILEALSCGTPVITTPNTCGPDILTEGVDGFIIPIRDSAAIAARLEWALSHPYQLRQMKLAASATAKRWTWDRFRSMIRAHYIRLTTIDTEGVR